MTAVRVYTVPGCIDCGAVKRLLEQAKIPYEEINVEQVPGAREALSLLSGRQSLPQVFVGNRFLGQVGEIRFLVASGRLRQIIEKMASEKPE